MQVAADTDAAGRAWQEVEAMRVRLQHEATAIAKAGREAEQRALEAEEGRTKLSGGLRQQQQQRHLSFEVASFETSKSHLQTTK